MRQTPAAASDRQHIYLPTHPIYIYYGKQKHSSAPAKAPPHGVLRENQHKNTIFIIALALLLCGAFFCGAAAAHEKYIQDVHDDITWSLWNESSSLPCNNPEPQDENTGYYLGTDVNLGDTWSFTAESGVINLCLNGHSIRTSAHRFGAIIRVESGATLNLYDCAGGGSITGNENAELSGGGVYVDDGGTFNMYGGEITCNIADTGGGVYVDGGGTFNISGNPVISGNTVDSGGKGANVYLWRAEQLILAGSFTGDIRISDIWNTPIAANSLFGLAAEGVTKEDAAHFKDDTGTLCGTVDGSTLIWTQYTPPSTTGVLAELVLSETDELVYEVSAETSFTWKNTRTSGYQLTFPDETVETVAVDMAKGTPVFREHTYEKQPSELSGWARQAKEAVGEDWRPSLPVEPVEVMESGWETNDFR